MMSSQVFRETVGHCKRMTRPKYLKLRFTQITNTDLAHIARVAILSHPVFTTKFGVSSAVLNPVVSHTRRRLSVVCEDTKLVLDVLWEMDRNL